MGLNHCYNYATDVMTDHAALPGDGTEGGQHGVARHPVVDVHVARVMREHDVGIDALLEALDSGALEQRQHEVGVRRVAAVGQMLAALDATMPSAEDRRP